MLLGGALSSAPPAPVQRHPERARCPECACALTQSSKGRQRCVVCGCTWRTDAEGPVVLEKGTPPQTVVNYNWPAEAARAAAAKVVTEVTGVTASS